MTGPDLAARLASGRHGAPDHDTCTCPRQPCGGVAEADMRPGCPFHDPNPCLLWHSGLDCPAAPTTGDLT